MRDIEAYTHDDKKRANNPPVGMAQHDKAKEKVKTYQFDPHLSTICTCPAMPSFSSREFMMTRLSPAISRFVQSTPC